MIRAFVALDLPAEIRDALPVAPPPWRPVPAESLHVTLAFLGSVDEGAVVEVDAAVAGALRPVGVLRLSRLRPLPPRRPRVLSVELADPSERCIDLQSEVASALAARGLYEPEHRRWLPHVTIGRARGPVDRRLELPAVEPLEFAPPSVSVYRSHLGRGPARYEALSTYALARAAEP